MIRIRLKKSFEFFLFTLVFVLFYFIGSMNAASKYHYQTTKVYNIILFLAYQTISVRESSVELHSFAWWHNSYSHFFFSKLYQKWKIRNDSSISSNVVLNLLLQIVKHSFRARATTQSLLLHKMRLQ